MPLLSALLLLPVTGSPFTLQAQEPQASPPAAPSSAALPAATAPDRAEQIRHVMETSQALDGVPFREVVQAASGFRVLAVNPESAADTALLDHLTKAAEALVLWMNQPNSPLRGLRRINEASLRIEDQLRLLLNAGDFTCAIPRTKGGAEQRSGYPDLKIVHIPSGCVTYLDPKLFEAKSRGSSLRTFYYEPRSLTGKIQSDARHLLLGIAHDGKDGAWTFQSWDLVDLYGFKVRLKAEFQGSNRDLYLTEQILRQSPKP